jgi:hypothetical protein
LEHTLSQQRTKQENLWEEIASLPKGATSAKTALHNVLNRLDESIAEGVEKVMALRATLAPIPDSEALTTLWEHREQIREGLRGADTIEKRRRVIDALNVTVSVRGVDGKPKATLHWWGMDTPLSFDDETPSGDEGPGKAPMSGLGEAKEGGGDIPILRAKGISSLLWVDMNLIVIRR